MGFLNLTRTHQFVTTVVTLIAGFSLFTSPALAEEKFPSKPITVVIHSSYGGGTDVTARMMMIRSRRELDTDMQVIAKRGGGGVKAHQYALSQPRDGYTLLALTQTHLYTIAQGKSPLKIDDMVGVARAMEDPTFITVRAESKFKNIGELVEASKKEPLNWGVAEIGGTEHIGLAAFAKKTGIKFKVVPFGSGGKMIQALLSGAVDASLPNVSEANQQVKDGKLRALVLLAKDRLAEYPDVPSSYELGYNTKTSTTRGYWVLKGTPQPVIDTLSKALVKAMKHDVFANYLKSSGLNPETSVAGHEVWDAQIKEEYTMAEEAMRDLKLIK